MKNLITMLVLLIGINSYAQSDISGEWKVGEKNTVIKIDQEKGVGKIISSDKTKVEIGKLMVKDLKKKKGKWVGKVYSPKRKEWYDAELTNKGNTLNVEISVGFFSKTIEWVKKKS
ncbi:MAG: hypothetical protein QMC21_04290 [Flavobacteriales bacterium]|mgnify:CR=1 FL=1|jgi:uncharacterized protein (DUF2147 family)|tara:strand:+ start:149 stop:496 length:348 start_codon:yes stop_codon:yes gene_type:complete